MITWQRLYRLEEKENKKWNKCDNEDDQDDEIKKEIDVDEEDDGKEVIDITDDTNENNEGEDEGPNNEKQIKRGKKTSKSEEKWRNYKYLYDFDEMINTLIVKKNRNKERVAILRDMMNSVLCIPASEAVCERFFRNLSLRVKKQYVTNLKCNKACMITYLNSNCSLVYDILKANGKGNYFWLFCVNTMSILCVCW